MTSGSPAECRADLDEIFRLSRSIRREARTGGRLRLIDDDTGRVIEVNAFGAALASRLVHGACLNDIVAEIRRRFPSDSNVAAKVSAFVGKLQTTGMIEGVLARPEPGRLYQFHTVDRPIRRISNLLNVFPTKVWLLLGALAITVALGSIVVVVSTHAMSSLWRVDPIQLLYVLPLTLGFTLLHETMHALVAGYQRVRVAAAGVRLRRRRPPIFFVRCGMQFTTLQKWGRVAICMAGPASDILVLGSISQALIWLPPESSARPVLSLCFIVKAIGLTANLSPIPKTDLSDAVMTYFDDYLLARKASWRRGPASSPEVSLYRRLLPIYIVSAMAFWTLLAVFGGAVH